MKRLRIFLVIILLNIILNIPIKNVLAASAFEQGLNATAVGTGHKDLPLKTPADMIGTVIGAVLALIGVVFLCLIIYSGYIWMTARGNEQQVEKAKSMLRESVIGLIIVLGAYAITLLMSGSVVTF